ncbi:cytochrome P450 [Amycolatopsis mediterranei]|uniref:cytochrome P450 n=1 Tax=Amycolatopsis mediterranei TaxID=33910 RepID=UPI00341A30C4
MTTSIGKPTLMDMFRPEWSDDPYRFYAAHRAVRPLFWDEFLRTWVVLDHATISALLKDDRLSCSRVREFHDRLPPDSRNRMAPLARTLVDMMVFNDPPRHRRLRKLPKSGFIPRHVREIRELIERTAGELVAELPVAGEFDVVADYAKPLTRRMIATMTGVSDDILHLLEDWKGLSHEFFVQSDAEIGRITALRQAFDEGLPVRRAGTGTDLFSRMIAEQLRADDYTDDELFANWLLLIDAGLSTTTYLLANAVQALLRHPDQLAELLDDPALMPGAVHELMRYDSSVLYTTRVARSDLAVRDRRIAAGESVTLVLAAGNRDPERYPEPDRLDLRRKANDNLSLGHGVHYCLGSAFALAEIEIGLAKLLEGVPGLRAVPHRPRWLQSINFRFLQRLPVAVGPESGGS